VHEILAELGATGWPKTSGGNGLHIYVRIEPRWSFADLRRAAHAFAREVERRAPDHVTTTWWRKDRDPAMLFVDYNQNARDHTSRPLAKLGAANRVQIALLVQDAAPAIPRTPADELLAGSPAGSLSRSRR
jgi:DNA primase